MKIMLPVGGDDVFDHLHNIYHRLLKTKEPIMTTFNGVSAIFFIDDSGLDHTHLLESLHKNPMDSNVVKAYYLKDVEDADPSGYTTVKKFYDDIKVKNMKYRGKVERINTIVYNWVHWDNPQQIKKKIIKILEE